MSVKSILAALCVLALGAGLAPAAQAQAPAATPEAAPATPKARTFKLTHESASAADDLEVDAEAEKWLPAIRPGTIEMSMGLGFMNLSGSLLEHEQMIYKYTTEATYWGDVVIKGQTAFNPVLRLGYTLKPWLTIEGFGGLSISEYTSTVENRRVRKNEEGSLAQDNPALGDYDAEARSLITLQGGLGLMVYPFNFGGDGNGRWHPYLTGQFGTISYDMNSDFTAGSTSSGDIAFGGGLRLLAERNVSLRLEATFHSNTIEFEPTEYFLETDEGTTLVPLMEYPRIDGDRYTERPITEFTSQTLSYLVWSVGFQGTF